MQHTLISQNASEDANIILGSAIDKSLTDEIIITVIATGFQRTAQKPESKVRSSDIFAKAAKTEDLIEPASTAKEIEETKIDLNDFDTPTFMRKKAASEVKAQEISE